MAVAIDSSALQTFLTNPVGPVMVHVKNQANEVANRARSIARNAEVARAVTVEPAADSGGPFFRVIADVPFAKAEETGTPPYPIYAKTKALHFHWRKLGVETFVPPGGGFRTDFDAEGRLFIGKGFVLHPGHKGTNFLTRALEEVIPRS